ncbi:uncharacterized protein K02A2.6-like [Mizuhopecten yessoensis]|uniref:uncharacterized protein K02A2.6-like n=1 Tax=Mizuhopecten yessoensis TaxID=6573 RepID=UPI000B45BACD|nr:uncharacterized protein K02A2.6-like [Mizuhopecten yessoensis]
MQVENTPVEMEIDTGASVTILSKRTLRNLEDQGTGPNLMGRDWLQTFKLDWANIFKLETSNMEGEVKAIIDAHQEVFKEGLGTVRGVKAKIYVDPEAHPRYFKPRPVPYSLKERIEKELDRLEREGTVEKVQFSEWAAPIVPIVKNDGSIRICGDYKTTVNGVSKLDNYPIPKIEDLYATLSGGKRFSKLNLSQAYQQLELDDESKKFVTINTHKGLYQYNRLPFGVSSAPGIFQRVMENLLQGIPHVLVRMDDILVTGVSQEEHLSHLREVLRRIRDAGIRLKASKCIFLAKEVVYLGHKVSEEGIQPVTEKVKAIQEMPAPTNLKELQAYLGMLNFYNRFLPNLATVLAPLHELLVKGKKWRWAKEQQTAFKKSKDLLISADVLVHFDSKEEVVLCCDASPYGVGAVLAIKMDDGAERPVGYASRTLTAAEKNYSHLEKEGLAMIFGVKKFHQYLFGNHFKMYTDHKPLLGLLKEDKKIPEMAAARIIRWALTLAAYEYTLEYREGKLNYADGLSRLPIEEKSTRTSQVPVPGEIKLVMEHLEETPVNAKKVREWTGQDPILAKVVDYVKSGWPDKNPSADMRPYYIVRKELSVEDGCLICGSRVVIPLKGHAPILETLHEGHPGTNRMKSLARGYVWWPKIDSDLEEEIRSCSLCQLNRKPPPEAPLHPWDWPNRPWGRIHIDYAGPFMGKMFLVVIDSHSKWMEAFPMKTSTSTATIEKLRVAFATHGLPEMIVSDNGSCFTSQEFDNFMKENGIRHVRSAPYHPASNGLAERAVQILKDGLKKQTDGTVEQKTSRFLLTYRITPQTTTGIAPCELLMNRRVRSRLDLVKPCLDTKVVRKQVGQKEYHDRTSKERNFTASDAVFIKNFAKGPKWLEGTIELRSGPVSYTVHLQDGRVMKRHVDHIRIRYSPDSTEVVDNYRGREMDDPRLPSVSQSTSVSPSTVLPISENPAEQIPENQFQRSELSETVSESPAILPARIRPERETKLPVKFKDYVC